MSAFRAIRRCSGCTAKGSRKATQALVQCRRCRRWFCPHYAGKVGADGMCRCTFCPERPGFS